MSNNNRGKAGRAGKRSKQVDTALEDSFPASDPPARNMSRATPPAAQQPKQQPQRRTRRSTAKSRVARADVREKLKARELQVQGRVMPRGRRLLSPVAWLRWLLRRTLRPAVRQF